MANKRWYQFLFSKTPMLVSIHGSISIAADASIISTNIKGATAAKTGTGEYTITLSEKYPSFKSFSVQLLAATAVDLVPQVLSATVSTGVIVININAGATPTNPSATCTLYFEGLLSNSSNSY